MEVSSLSVQISIFHYAEDEKLYFNDLLVMLVKSIRELTQYPYKLNIIDNEMQPKAREDLEAKLPNIEIIRVPKHERLCGPAGINGCITNNKEDYLVILHTDVLVTWNWLSSWMQNIVNAELFYGIPCASTCLLLPYPANDATDKLPWKLGAVEGHDRRGGNSVKNIENYFDNNGIPWRPWRGLPIAVSEPGLVMDVGHQLGLYIASKEFWEEVGLHDETMLSTFDDLDMGIRTLKTRCRLLISEKVWLHHIGATHQGTGCFTDRNPEPFIRKWGKEPLIKMQNGTFWKELHDAQREKYGN